MWNCQANAAIRVRVTSKRWDHCAQAGWGDELLVTSQNGNVIRIPLRDIRMQGRNTQGVRITPSGGGGELVSSGGV
ncbi:MAG: hypothetical protein KAR25_03545 [Methanosarcinales archaeon]|nr:hypothetical protein [Methanosarcinales archaeon]